GIFAQKAVRDAKKEQVLVSELQTIAPKAVDTFNAATAAMDGGDFATCTNKYQDVLKSAPNFDPATRRLGFCLIGTGKRDEGYAMIQRALDHQRSADNLLSMAAARVDPGPDNSYRPPDGELKKALDLAVESSKVGNENDADTWFLIAELSLSTDQIDQFY